MLPADADEETVIRFARAYILMLMGSSLFSDKSGDAVQLVYLPLLRDLDDAGRYSWGSAVLGYTYRQLCSATKKGARELCGCPLLVQFWAWEHIHIGRPVIRGLRNPPEEEEDDAPLLGSQHVPWVDPLAVWYVSLYSLWSFAFLVISLTIRYLFDAVGYE